MTNNIYLVVLGENPNFEELCVNLLILQVASVFFFFFLQSNVKLCIFKIRHIFGSYM